MDRKNFAKELEQRTRRFAVKIIRLSMTLPNTTEGKIVRNQITKAGTSIGAQLSRSDSILRQNPEFSSFNSDMQSGLAAKCRLSYYAGNRDQHIEWTNLEPVKS